MFGSTSLCRALPLSLALLLAGGLAAALAQAEPAATIADQVAAIGKEHQELERRFYEELTAAKHDNEKVNKANDDYRTATRKLVDRLGTLIKAHGTDPAAFEGMMILVGQMRYPLYDEMTQLVLDHHLANPGMGKFCFQLRYRTNEDWSKRILLAAAEKHPNPDVRGQAIFSLGDYHRYKAMPFGRELPEDEKAVLLAKATEFYQQTIENYAKTPTPDGKTTLGEKAAHELTRLRNLPNLEVGRPAPPITGDDLDGKPLRLEDYRGKVVLLVFWGSWCGPCMALVPHERELFDRHRDKEFILLGVNCGDTREKAQATVQEKQMAWRHWWDSEEIRGPIETDYNVPHWPRIFLIDKTGLIRGIDLYAPELDEQIEKLLGEI